MMRVTRCASSPFRERRNQLKSQARFSSSEWKQQFRLFFCYCGGILQVSRHWCLAVSCLNSQFGFDGPSLFVQRT